MSVWNFILTEAMVGDILPPSTKEVFLTAGCPDSFLDPVLSYSVTSTVLLSPIYHCCSYYIVNSNIMKVTAYPQME